MSWSFGEAVGFIQFLPDWFFWLDLRLAFVLKCVWVPDPLEFHCSFYCLSNNPSSSPPLAAAEWCFQRPLLLKVYLPFTANNPYSRISTLSLLVTIVLRLIHRGIPLIISRITQPKLQISIVQAFSYSSR